MLYWAASGQKNRNFSLSTGCCFSTRVGIMEPAGSAPEDTVPPIPDFLQDVVKPDQTNAATIVCRLCSCKILVPATASLKYLPVCSYMSRVSEWSSQHDLPLRKDQGEATEHWFWEVQKMETFWNIGFTHASGSRKFLTCADCEQEVLGYCASSDMNLLWLAAGRVKHLPDGSAPSAAPPGDA